VADPSEYHVRQGGPEDAAAVAACVDEAYRQYVARIGRPPVPMTEDYDVVLRDYDVTVVESAGRVVAALVVGEADEGFLLENVAVVPTHRGQGLGRRLLELAELKACRAGYDSIYLYKNEAMTENRALYARIGYVEYARRVEHGLRRVYMRKRLGCSEPS